MTNREMILEILAQLRSDKGLPPRPLSDSDSIGEEGLGLDSLDMATLIAALDARLNFDPFAHGTPRFQTLGDLIRLFDGQGGR